MDRPRCGILGATGMIGQRFVQFLSDHPWFDLVALYTSREADGKRYSDVVSWMVGPDAPEKAASLRMSEYESGSFNDVDLLFSALPTSAASRFERRLSGMGIHVVTNSSFHRMDPDVPLVIPEVNGDHLELMRAKEGILAANPNCTTTGLAMALAPIRDMLVGDAFVSSYQAISGAGYPGVASLDIMGNVVPFIRDEEEKVEEGPAKILGKLDGGRVRSHAIKVHANCVRVGVKDGHLISLSTKVADGCDEEDIIDMLRSVKGLDGLPTAPAKPLAVRMEEDRPRPDLDAFAGKPPGMTVSVGRVRIKDGVLRMFVLVNNTIRGGAGNAVLIAEHCMREGLI